MKRHDGGLARAFPGPDPRDRRKRRNPALGFECMERRILCAAGDLDTTFNGSGKEAIRVGTSAGGNPGDIARAVAVQPDGKIVIAGTTSNGSETDFAAVRLNANGSLDTSFGNKGMAVVPVSYRGQPLPSDDVRALSIQPDGKIIIAGTAGGSADNSDMAVVRLAADGTPDATFGSGGIATIAFPGSARGFAVGVQSGGSIIVAGDAQLVAGSVGTSFAVARVTAAGTLDTSFGSGGVQTVSFTSDNSSQDSAHAAAIASDGSIVLAGVHSAGIVTSTFAVIRLTAQGQIDSGFGSGGLQSFAVSAGQNPVDVGNGVALQSNGSIVVVGSAGQHGFGVARLTTSGQLDVSFNGGGTLNVQFPDPSLGGSQFAEANAVAIGTGGVIYVAGAIGPLGVHADFEIVRLTPAGLLDSSFGDGGKKRVAFDLGGTGTNSDDDEVYALALDGDGKLVAAGYAAPAVDFFFSYEFAVIRLLTATADSGGGSGGGGGNGGGGDTPRHHYVAPPPWHRARRSRSKSKPIVADPPLPAGFYRTPPRILDVRVVEGMHGSQQIILHLDQRIASRRMMARTMFDLTRRNDGVEAHIVRAVYNAWPRTITLTLASRPSLQGTFRLTVSSGGIVNLLDQTLDGDGKGIGGVDFATSVTL